MAGPDKVTASASFSAGLCKARLVEQRRRVGCTLKSTRIFMRYKELQRTNVSARICFSELSRICTFETLLSFVESGNQIIAKACPFTNLKFGCNYSDFSKVALPSSVKLLLLNCTSSSRAAGLIGEVSGLKKKYKSDCHSRPKNLFRKGSTQNRRQKDPSWACWLC